MDIADVKAGRDRSSQDVAWMVVGSLVAGMAFYGAIGWLVGRWLGSTPIPTACGVIFGMAAGIYLIYLRLDRATAAASAVSRRAAVSTGTSSSGTPLGTARG